MAARALVLASLLAGALYHPGPSHAASACPGDCNGDGAVTVDELIVGVTIALGEQALSTCPAFDVRSDQVVTVDELLAAIDAALSGCATSTPPLQSSDPVDGAAAVPRTAWIRLNFADTVDSGALRGFALACDATRHDV